jgi:iron-only hydrogenase group A
MSIDIEVNNEIIKAKKNETILEALNRNGINLPTLCHMNDFSPTGACRMCVVEIEGKKELIPSCSYLIEGWMKIKTHSARVIKARKMIVELLLSNHPDDCFYCIKNQNCELQKLAYELNIRERKITGKKTSSKLDYSSPAIVRDTAKCILCERCVRVCDEIIGVSTLDIINRGNDTIIATSMNKDLNFSSCINCGQCILVCPTGALHERTNFDLLNEVLNNQKIKVVAQYSHSVAVSLANELGLKSGKDISQYLNALLRKIGFDKIYYSSFGGDIAIHEQALELADIIKNGDQKPLISSFCPAWVKYIEQSYPDLIPYVSRVKSPQQIMGALIKSNIAKEEKENHEKIFSVSIVPCTAMKFEASREEMTQRGVSDIDLVITSRELAKLIQLYGLSIENIDPEMADEPFNNRSTASLLTSVSGGLCESIIRSLYKNITGKNITKKKILALRTNKLIKKQSVNIDKTNLEFVAVSGLKNAINILDDIRNKKSKIDFLEIMACADGCINGGGQPLCCNDKEIRARSKTIYSIDEKETIRVAGDNEKLQDFYKNYFNINENSKKILYTSYSQRNVMK